jgi:arylsulfatase
MLRSRRARRLASLLLWLGFATACGGSRAPDLLVLISVDTLRSDRLGAYGSDLGATPNLDRLAAESVVFTAAYAPTSHTLPSVISLMTGVYPEEAGIESNESMLASGVPTLAMALQDAGWRTRAVVSNWVLRRSSGLASGFDDYDDSLLQREATRPMPERTAEDTTTAALRATRECREEPGARCFVWVHYQDPHGPYTPPADLRDRFLERERAAPEGRRLLELRSDFVGLGGLPNYQALGDEREVAFYRAGYDGEVAFLDQEIGRLLAGLGAESEGAAIAFTADHGEGLGEGDYWFAHGEHLTDALVRVPLWLRIPGVDSERRDDVATLLDLHATLRALAGAASADAGSGRDLLAPEAAQRSSRVYLATLRGSNVARLGWIEDGYKYVVAYRDGVWHGQLFRLGRDDVDLAAPAPQIAASMREKLAVFREQMLRPAPIVRQELSEEDRANLRVLGYEATPPAEAPAPLR